MKTKEELNVLKEKAETMSKKLHELTDEELEQVNGGSLYSGPVFRYTIQRGDCLSVIAQRYHTTVAVLLELNPYITNPNVIHAGKTLLVPYIK